MSVQGDEAVRPDAHAKALARIAELERILGAFLPEAAREGFSSRTLSDGSLRVEYGMGTENLATLVGNRFTRGVDLVVREPLLLYPAEARALGAALIACAAVAEDTENQT